MDSVLSWLPEDDNPAVQYRARTEILGEKADKRKAIDWLSAFLPKDWRDKKGLWGC